MQDRSRLTERLVEFYQQYGAGSTAADIPPWNPSRRSRRPFPAREVTLAAALVAFMAIIAISVWRVAWVERANFVPEHGTAAPPSAPSAELIQRPSVVTIAPSLFRWDTLRLRPLDLPALSAGAVCPVTITSKSHKNIQPVVDGAKAPQFGYGSGPVYLSGITFFYPTGINNTVWLSTPEYTGPILVRGSRLDSPSAVGFSAFAADWAKGELLRTVDLHSTSRTGQDVVVVRDVKVYSELDLPASDRPGAPGTAWRMWLTRTHIETPGCYAVRVDGLDFTEVFVFEAPNASPPGG
jgi:hypothetical protein